MRFEPRPTRGVPDVRRRVWRALTAAVLATTPVAVHAVGTAAGTAIQNQATVDFSIGGTPASVASNTSAITVAEIVDVTVAVQSPTVAVPAGTSGAALVFLVTNTGNASETFLLTGDSVLVGDDFDPIPTAPFLYFDSDGSGDLSPTDTPYVAGGNDPVLAADTSVTIIVVNDIPNGLPDGNRGRSELRAAASTGTGAPGTLFAGQGTGGVDVLLGTSGGQAAVFGEYIVGDILVSALKSQTVADPFGGGQPVPGATIAYQIVVNATGSGTALGATFTDAIPANTTYVAASLRLNGGALSDAADADAGALAGAPTPAITVALGNLTAASGPQTIEFTVTIN